MNIQKISPLYFNGLFQVTKNCFINTDNVTGIREEYVNSEPRVYVYLNNNLSNNNKILTDFLLLEGALNAYSKAAASKDAIVCK